MLVTWTYRVSAKKFAMIDKYFFECILKICTMNNLSLLFKFVWAMSSLGNHKANRVNLLIKFEVVNYFKALCLVGFKAKKCTVFRYPLEA